MRSGWQCDEPLILRHFVWIALLITTGAALAPPATDSGRYSPAPAGAGGIGKRNVGLEISAMMGWQGTAWLEREEREELTDLLLAALSLKPGTKMIDARIRREAAVFALEWQRTAGTLPQQHVVMFRKRD